MINGLLGAHQYSSEPSASSSIAQSYLILDSNAAEIRNAKGEDTDDPFNKFWDAVEVLVHKISGPVAFTTAPLSDFDGFKQQQTGESSYSLLFFTC